MCHRSAKTCSPKRTRKSVITDNYLTAEGAEVTEETNNRVKDKTIIRRSYVALGLAPDVKDVCVVIPAHPGSGIGVRGRARNPVE